MRYAFDDFVLDLGRRELWRGAGHLAVEPQVFDLLVYLVENRDRVVSRDDLLTAIWDGRIVSDSAITNAINGTRRAIDDSGAEQRLIRTAPRKGFRFIGAVKEADDQTPLVRAVVASPYRRGRSLAVAGSLLLLCIAIVAGSSWLRLDSWSQKPGFWSQKSDSGPQKPDPGSQKPEARFGLPKLPFNDPGSTSSQSSLGAGITDRLSIDLSYNQTLATRAPTPSPQGPPPAVSAPVPRAHLPESQPITIGPQPSVPSGRLLSQVAAAVPTLPPENQIWARLRQVALAEGVMVPLASNPAFKEAVASGVDAEIILPSIMPDEFADNHAVELEICMRWFSSDAGQMAKVEAPLGYANVRAHALFHRDYLQKQQAAAAPQPPPVAPPRPRR